MPSTAVASSRYGSATCVSTHFKAVNNPLPPPLLMMTNILRILCSAAMLAAVAAQPASHGCAADMAGGTGGASAGRVDIEDLLFVLANFGIKNCPTVANPGSPPRPAPSPTAPPSPPQGGSPPTPPPSTPTTPPPPSPPKGGSPPAPPPPKGGSPPPPSPPKVVSKCGKCGNTVGCSWRGKCRTAAKDKATKQKCQANGGVWCPFSVPVSQSVYVPKPVPCSDQRDLLVMYSCDQHFQKCSQLAKAAKQKVCLSSYKHASNVCKADHTLCTKPLTVTRSGCQKTWSRTIQGCENVKTQCTRNTVRACSVGGKSIGFICKVQERAAQACRPVCNPRICNVFGCTPQRCTNCNMQKNALASCKSRAKAMQRGCENNARRTCDAQRNACRGTADTAKRTCEGGVATALRGCDSKRKTCDGMATAGKVTCEKGVGLADIGCTGAMKICIHSMCPWPRCKKCKSCYLNSIKQGRMAPVAKCAEQERVKIRVPNPLPNGASFGPGDGYCNANNGDSGKKCFNYYNGPGRNDFKLEAVMMTKEEYDMFQKKNNPKYTQLCHVMAKNVSSKTAFPGFFLKARARIGNWFHAVGCPSNWMNCIQRPAGCVSKTADLLGQLMGLDNSKNEYAVDVCSDLNGGTCSAAGSPAQGRRNYRRHLRAGLFRRFLQNGTLTRPVTIATGASNAASSGGAQGYGTG